MTDILFRLVQNIKKACHCIIEVISPRVCVVCGSVLDEKEKCVCGQCMKKISYTDYSLIQSNPMEIRIEELTGHKISAMSVMAYLHDGVSGKAVSAFKYHSRQDVALWAGWQIGQELSKSKRFDEYDVFVPIPLHAKRQKKRGYNQSEMLCRGIITKTKGTVSLALERVVNTSAQARLTRAERWENARGIFSVKDPQMVKDKNVVVVDDVFTTGATVSQAVLVLLHSGAKKVAVVTLASGE